MTVSCNAAGARPLPPVSPPSARQQPWPPSWRQAPAAVDDAASLQFGFGACARAGCRCTHYRGLAGSCANDGCRHPIGDHW
ncbi:MAG: hypothetical protein NTW01_17185 [Gammaproteobacteria bacterium]|nr:hypothetical protein [Gammaproteobacteria bacterium]